MNFVKQLEAWLGWCPKMDAAAGRGQAKIYETAVAAPASGTTTYLQEKGIVDYGQTAISVPFFIVAIVGVVVAFTLLRLVRPILAGILLSVFVFAVAAVELYHSRTGTTISVTSTAVVIHRHLLRPLVITKDTIADIEVRKNKLPVPLPVLAAGVAVFIGCAALGFYELAPSGQGMGGASGSLVPVVLFLCIILLFLCSFHRSYVRSRYAQVIAITTTTRKMIAMYVDDPSSLAEALEVS